MSRTAHVHCVDCGQRKEPGLHYLRPRCSACSVVFDKQMRECNLAVNGAIARGRLARAKGQDCVDCGAPAFDLDHRDYGKPLEVQPVCRACNIKRGPAKYVRRPDQHPAPAVVGG